MIFFLCFPCAAGCLIEMSKPAVRLTEKEQTVCLFVRMQISEKSACGEKENELFVAARPM